MKELFFGWSGVSRVAQKAIGAWRSLSTRKARHRLLAEQADLLAEKSYLTGLVPERCCRSAPDGEPARRHAANNRRRTEIAEELNRLMRGKSVIRPRPATAIDALNT